MMKKWIIGIIALAIVLGSWRVGTRWYVLRKLYRHPETRHRIAIIPTELDLEKVQETHGVTCNVGYAEFVIPSTDSVDLKTTGNGLLVLANTKHLRIAFLIPLDPSAPDKATAAFTKELSKLPADHPFRVELTSSSTTYLDLQICMERTVPEPFWKMLFQDSTVFAFKTTQLFLKGKRTGLGMRSVHIYHTPETRGLILAGKNPGDLSRAHVTIENRTGTQAVGMHIRMADGNTNDVMKILPLILKTFRFKTEHLGSEDEIRKIITEAKIMPRVEKKESPMIKSPISSEGVPPDDK